MIHNTQFAENSPIIQIYREFLKAARGVLSENEKHVKEQELVEVVNVRVRSMWL
ncbi:MAG: hypothetical protein QXS76_00100 [Candidatus Bathyarchaeia archaeon]